MAALDHQAATPCLHLLRLGAECAERPGDGATQERFLQRGRAIEDGEPWACATLWVANASRLFTKGEVEAAKRLLKRAAETFGELGDERSRAVTMGNYADILLRRKLDKALRILRQEVLPAFGRLDDVQALRVGRANLSQRLVIPNNNRDRTEAQRLLCLALADARRMRLPKAQEIEAILARFRLSCD